MNEKLKLKNKRVSKIVLISGIIHLFTPLLFLGVIFLIVSAVMWRKYR